LSINLSNSLVVCDLIILLLAFLGFNIFVYLAKGTQDITNFFAPLIEKIFGTTVSVTGQTVDVAAVAALLTTIEAVPAFTPVRLKDVTPAEPTADVPALLMIVVVHHRDPY
jgi:hypothetical protein